MDTHDLGISRRLGAGGRADRPGGANRPLRSVRRLLILFAGVLLAMQAFSLRQQELAIYAPDRSNGCGRWGGGWLVPDFEFTPACQSHDLCIQQGEPARMCAEAFYQDMRAACIGRGTACDVVAFIYALAAGRR